MSFYILSIYTPIEPLRPSPVKMNTLKAVLVAVLAAAFAAAVPITFSPGPPGIHACPEYRIAFCPCGEELVLLPPCYNGNCIPATT